MLRRLGVLLFCLSLTSCTALPSHQQRVAEADRLAAEKHWHSVVLNTGSFDLVAYLADGIAPAEQVTVYIEGDGLAWVSSELPSVDPTPVNPLALRLALAQPKDKAAYLGRPCQFVNITADGLCNRSYWTDKRFSPEIISAMNAALDQVKQRMAAKTLTLVGYSGGGAVAVLLAARRSDINQLITVAGNLDTLVWTRHHALSPLTGSLNPADESERLTGIRQIHWVGDADETMPALIAQSYAARFLQPPYPEINILHAYTHQCCWVSNWPELWQKSQREQNQGRTKTKID